MEIPIPLSWRINGMGTAMNPLNEEPDSARGPAMSLVFDTILTTIPVQLNLSASFGGRHDEGKAGRIAAVAGLAEMW